MPGEIDFKPLILDLTDPFHLPCGRALGSRVELFLLDLLRERTREEQVILESGLSHAERAEKNARKNDPTTLRFEARAWVRRILGYYIGIPAREVLFHKGPAGKPWVAHPDLYFNLSHAGRYLLLAISARGQLGCDIEVERPRKQLESLVERVFAEEEQRRMRKRHATSPLFEFYRGWTIKEAYVKAVGKGIALGLHQVVVSDNPLQFLSLPQGNPDDFRIWHEACAGIHLSLVCPGPDLDIRLWDETAVMLGRMGL